MMNEAVISIKDISKSFFGITALENVCFDIAKGEIVGLIGENGAGKSTMMNILGGVIQPDNGIMLLNGKPYKPSFASDASSSGIMFVHQELNLFDNLTVGENLYINNFPTLENLPFISNNLINELSISVLEQVGLDIAPSTRVERLSPGEKQLVEIAKAVNTKPDIIIFDEPTSSLTERETKQLFSLIRKINSEGTTIIYISHILSDIVALTDSIKVLRDGMLVSEGLTRDYTIEMMIASMVGRELQQLFPDRTSKPKSKIMLNIAHLSKKRMVKDICFDIHEGEVLGIFGLMGAGRTELARMIFGLDDFDEGDITINSESLINPAPSGCIKNKMAFITEDRRDEGLLMEKSIFDNLSLVGLPLFNRKCLSFIDTNRIRIEINRLLELLHIKCGTVEKATARSLSGGNQQKVVIGKWLLVKPDVMILDEPTRGVDVGAKFEIYKLIDQLAGRGSAIMFISSELEELTGMCDRILVMSQGEIVGDFFRDSFDTQEILASAFRQGKAAV